MFDGKSLMEDEIWRQTHNCPVCKEPANERARRKKKGVWAWVYRHFYMGRTKYCRSTVEAPAPMKSRRVWKIKPVTKIVPDKRRKKLEKQERKEAKS